MSRLKRLIVEVHQRSLWQALVLYLGASFAVLEAADLLIARFGLPGWLFPVAFALLVIGLPVVVVASLAREEIYGDEVPEEHAAAAAEEDRRLRLLTWRTAGLSFMAALAVWGVVAAGLLLFGGYGPLPTDERPSIAVLPLDNLSGDEAVAPFVDGIHDDILTHLAKIGGLRPISRTSVLEYKDTRKNLRQIAEELDVATVLEGGVQWAGDRVRINIQLIDARTDKHLWAESYDRELTAENVFAVQTDIAQRIASALRVQLSPDEQRRIAVRPTENLQAYEYYSRGRFEFYKYTPDGNAAAIELFERALELDENYGLALAGLSLCQSMFGRRWSDDREWLSRAEANARRALEIDPDLAEAHFALAFVYESRRMFDEAEAEIKLVLELNPNHAHGHDSLGDVYSIRGLLEEALAEYAISLRLDPYLVPALANAAHVHTLSGQYAEALRKSRKGLELHPDHEAFPDVTGNVLQAQGHYQAAAGSYRTALTIDPDDDRVLVNLAHSLIKLGDLAGAESVAGALERGARVEANNYIRGLIDLAQGDIDRAFEWFSELTPIASSVGIPLPDRGRETALAKAHLANGQPGLAARQLEAALRDAPYLRVLRYELAKALEEAGENDRAVAEYRTFLESWSAADPEAPALIDAENRLAALSLNPS